MRMNKEMVVWQSKNTPLHFFSRLLPSMSTLSLESHRPSRWNFIKARDLVCQGVDQRQIELDSVRTEKWVSVVVGEARRFPVAKWGPLEEKCQLQSNYNLLSPPQLQLRSSLPAEANTTAGYLCRAAAGRFLHFVCKMLTRGDKLFLKHINLVI